LVPEEGKKDGCFSYTKVARTTISTNENKFFFYPEMSVNQLKFDKYILNSIANLLGLGAIYHYPDKAIAKLSIVGLSRIQHIILPFFLQYPLVGHKLIQYQVWQKAVLLAICNPKYSIDRELRMLELMAELSNLNGNVEQKKFITRLKSKSNATPKVE
jgi:hypothetical protein